MVPEELIWKLLARKLAGEASRDDLQELNGLLKDDPVMDRKVKMMTAFWYLRLKNEEPTNKNHN